MEEDEKGGVLNTNTSGLIKMAIFSMIAIIIVATVAVPILANVGTVTRTEYNEGVRVTDVFEKYSDIMDTSDELTGIVFKDDYVQLVYNADKRINILSKSDINEDYPVFISWQHITEPFYLDWWSYVTYDGSTNKYTTHSCDVAGWTTSENMNVHQSLFGGHCFVQDPQGDYVIADGSIRYTDGNTSGVTLDAQHLLWVENGSATMRTWNGSNFATLSTGDAVYSETETDGVKTLSGITFNSVSADWVIGPKGITTTDNYIDGTQIGTLIGIIPILIVAGIIVAIIKGRDLSDR